MPICPICGAVVRKGTTTCSCGATLATSSDDELDHLLSDEARKVELFQDLKAKCLEAFEDEDYQKSFDYSTQALDLGIGSDVELSFARGKSLYYMDRFLDSAKCFDEYIKEYKNSFYRFSNISGAYEWKAAALWQLGDSFEAMKCYYSALDNVDSQPCSIDEKMEMRTRIKTSKMKLIRQSAEKGVSNPRIGVIDDEVYEVMKSLYPNIYVTMQNLYDAIGSVETDDCTFESLILRDGHVHAVFSSSGESIEKLFDGTSTFK